MKAYSMDLRERVIKDCDAGLSTKVVAEKYSVSPAWSAGVSLAMIDIIPSSGAEKDKSFKGIIQRDGDTLTLCFREPGGDRPSAFTSKAGDKTTLIEFKREPKSVTPPMLKTGHVSIIDFGRFGHVRIEQHRIANMLTGIQFGTGRVLRSTRKSQAGRRNCGSLSKTTRCGVVRAVRFDQVRVSIFCHRLLL